MLLNQTTYHFIGVMGVPGRLAAEQVIANRS